MINGKMLFNFLVLGFDLSILWDVFWRNVSVLLYVVGSSSQKEKKMGEAPTSKVGNIPLKIFLQKNPNNV